MRKGEVSGRWLEIHIDVYNMHCSCKDIKASESRSVKWAEIVPDECAVFSWIL